jgi:hypothetical protein
MQLLPGEPYTHGVYVRAANSNRTTANYTNIWTCWALSMYGTVRSAAYSDWLSLYWQPRIQIIRTSGHAGHCGVPDPDVSTVGSISYS